MAAEPDEPKLQFPLLKEDDELDKLIVEMLGPEKAKQLAASNAASVAPMDSIPVHDSMKEIGKNLPTVESIDEPNGTMLSVYKAGEMGKRAGGLSEYGGKINDSNLMGLNDSGYGQLGTVHAGLANDTQEGISDNDSLINKRFISQEEIDRYCKPQNLCIYNPEESGFKYKVMGLFGMPIIDPERPSVYITLATVIPPAGPYK